MPKSVTKSADTTAAGLVNTFLANSAGVLTSVKPFLRGYLDTRSILAFSETCKTALDISSDVRKKLVLENLLRAVVCGNEDLARKFVTSRPELLLDTSAIVTDLSGKEIKNLTPLEAAICAMDIDMVEMIKEVLYQKLQNRVELSFEPDLEIQRQFATIYPNGDIDSVETAQNFAAEKFKTSTLTAIFTAINAATDEQVRFELNTPGIHNPDSQLNTVLHNFRVQFSATSYQELIFNPFYLLKAFEFHDQRLYNFNGNAHEQWNLRRSLFWRQVIGFVQRHLPACYLQAFAQGIYYIAEEGEKLKRDFEFRVDKGLSMRPDALNNLGYKYAARAAMGGRPRGDTAISVVGSLSKIIANKKIRFEELTRPAESYTRRSCLPTRCVIT